MARIGRFDGRHDGQIGDLDVQFRKEGRDAGRVVAKIVRTVARRRTHIDIGRRVLVDQAYGNIRGKSEKGANSARASMVISVASAEVPSG